MGAGTGDYDVIGYFVDENTVEIRELINQTGESASARAKWVTVTRTVNAVESYKFVLLPVPRMPVVVGLPERICTYTMSLSMPTSKLFRLMLCYESMKSLLRKKTRTLIGTSWHAFSIAHMIALRQAGTETCLRSGMIGGLDKITGMRLAETAKFRAPKIRFER